MRRAYRLRCSYRMFALCSRSHTKGVNNASTRLYDLSPLEIQYIHFLDDSSSRIPPRRENNNNKIQMCRQKKRSIDCKQPRYMGSNVTSQSTSCRMQCCCFNRDIFQNKLIDLRICYYFVCLANDTEIIDVLRTQ